MTTKDQVLARHPEAWAVKMNYGNGYAPVWKVFPQAWETELARGANEQAAWDAAAAALAEQA